MSNEEKYYHIFAIIDGEVFAKTNTNREQVDRYLNDTTPDQVKYSQVKIYTSKIKIERLLPKIFVKLSD